MSNQITYEIACYSYISNTVSKIYKCLHRKVHRSSNLYIHEKKNAQEKMYYMHVFESHSLNEINIILHKVL